ncbi:hypothetical protein C8R47DRAFT_1070458 [Mycena vitilis]|nr:hypothetical protein C8R47DRAFT_1070458 [Mycena vitilis]
MVAAKSSRTGHTQLSQLLGLTAFKSQAAHFTKSGNTVLSEQVLANTSDNRTVDTILDRIDSGRRETGHPKPYGDAPPRLERIGLAVLDLRVTCSTLQGLWMHQDLTLTPPVLRSVYERRGVQLSPFADAGQQSLSDHGRRALVSSACRQKLTCIVHRRINEVNTASGEWIESYDARFADSKGLTKVTHVQSFTYRDWQISRNILAGLRAREEDCGRRRRRAILGRRIPTSHYPGNRLAWRDSRSKTKMDESAKPSRSN